MSQIITTRLSETGVNQGQRVKTELATKTEKGGMSDTEER